MLNKDRSLYFLHILVNIEMMVTDLDSATDPIDLRAKQDVLTAYLKKEITACALRAANAKAESIRRQRPATGPIPTPDS